MNIKHTITQIVLIAGDLAVLFVSLYAALFVRKTLGTDYEINFSQHIVPFGILFIIWLFIFYLFLLYDPRTLKNNVQFLSLYGWAIGVNIILAVMFFYALPFWGVTPKTNLVLFLIAFNILYLPWRRLYNRIIGTKLPNLNVLLFGSGSETEELVDVIELNPQLGYRIVRWERELNPRDLLQNAIVEKGISIIVIPHESKNDPAFIRALIENLSLDISIVDVASLYEDMLKKIPITSIGENWIIENLAKGKKAFYDKVIRIFDVFASILLGIIFSPIFILSVLFIIIDSRGGAIYKQRRVGKNGKEFTLYKLRTMNVDAERDGPQWSSASDNRVTRVGKFIRRTHFDELPQIFNILRGEISMVGPRPERPEFVEKLNKEISFYNIRHLVRPGFTGWAQINYRYGSSVEDAYRKLQYDIYFIKNRSLYLYIITLLKTARVFVSNPK